MTRQDFLTAIAQLNLKPDDYIVTGSGILCVLGIREADDVDLCVTPALFEGFEKKGWTLKTFPNDRSYYLTRGIYEIGLDWDSHDNQPNLFELKKTQVLFEGVPFINVDRLKAWKFGKNMPKHVKDIELINNYLQTANL